jgi:hypothetical protein
MEKNGMIIIGWPESRKLPKHVFEVQKAGMENAPIAPLEISTIN